LNNFSVRHEAYQTLPEPKNGPYGHAQATGTWYRNAAGNAGRGGHRGHRGHRGSQGFFSRVTPCFGLLKGGFEVFYHAK